MYLEYQITEEILAEQFKMVDLFPDAFCYTDYLLIQWACMVSQCPNEDFSIDQINKMEQTLKEIKNKTF